MERESKFKWLNNIFNSVYSLNTKKNQIDRETNNKYYIQMNLVMSNSCQVEIFLKSLFKLGAFQLNLLLLSQISMCRVSRSSFSVPNIQNTFKLCSLCQNYKLNQLINLSRCQQHGLRCLLHQVIFILITANYHL